MSFFRNHFEKLYIMVSESPFDSFEAVAALAIPLILVVFMFNWRVKQSMKKQEKIQKRREKLLKKLNASRKEEEEVEDDQVLTEAIRLMEEKVKKCN